MSRCSEGLNEMAVSASYGYRNIVRSWAIVWQMNLLDFTQRFLDDFVWVFFWNSSYWTLYNEYSCKTQNTWI